MSIDHVHVFVTVDTTNTPMAAYCDNVDNKENDFIIAKAKEILYENTKGIGVYLYPLSEWTFHRMRDIGSWEAGWDGKELFETSQGVATIVYEYEEFATCENSKEAFAILKACVHSKLQKKHTNKQDKKKEKKTKCEK